MDKDLLSRLGQILADIFNVSTDNIKLDSSPDTIENWDSVNHVAMVIALEQEFGVEVAPEEIEQLFTVEMIWKMLGRKLSDPKIAGDS
jgi:acyl carrier protein